MALCCSFAHSFSPSKPMAVVVNHCFYTCSLKSHVSPFWNSNQSFSSKLLSLSIARKKPRTLLQGKVFNFSITSIFSLIVQKFYWRSTSIDENCPFIAFSCVIFLLTWSCFCNLDLFPSDFKLIVGLFILGIVKWKLVFTFWA